MTAQDDTVVLSVTIEMVPTLPSTYADFLTLIRVLERQLELSAPSAAVFAGGEHDCGKIGG